MNPASIAPGALPHILPIILLVCSNLFMTLAWYGHLKYKSLALVTVVLVSWGIAFVEYCFAVPANRIGSAVYSPAELKTIQEVITLLVFAGFTLDLFQGAAQPDAGRGLPADRTRRDAGVSRPSLNRAAMLWGRCKASGWLSPPEAGQKLDASKEVADRQHHIGDDGDPEAMVGNERNWREFANHR